MRDDFKLTTEDHTQFVKRSTGPTQQFHEEAVGLEALRKTGTIRVVKVIAVSDHSITLERIQTETPTAKFWQQLGERLAELHKLHHSHFGFTLDNHIGHTPQPNPRLPTSAIKWADYFITYRLRELLHHPRLIAHTELNALFAQAEPVIRELLLRVEEPPALVHGDLWSGNVLCAKDQEPVLIDPAPYWGHREVDIAMSELFGGFNEEFYETYRARLPLDPGYDQRRDIYNLYHLFNHWILFGGRYADQALATLKRTFKLS